MRCGSVKEVSARNSTPIVNTSIYRPEIENGILGPESALIRWENCYPERVRSGNIRAGHMCRRRGRLSVEGWG